MHTLGHSDFFYLFERLENNEAEMNAKLYLTYKSLFPFLATVSVYSSMFQKCAKRGLKIFPKKMNL